MVAVAAILEGLLRTDLPNATGEVILALVLLPTLLWRRTRPLLMLVITFVPTAAAPLLMGYEPEMVTLVYLLILPYAVFRWGSGREVLAGAVFVLIKIGLHAAFGYLSFVDAVLGLVVMFAAFALAFALRYRARLRSASSTRPSCWNANNWPAICTTPWPTTSRRWRSAPRPASRSPRPPSASTPPSTRCG